MLKGILKRIKSKKAESTSVGTMLSVIAFVIFLALFVSIFVFYIQYMSLAGFTDTCMEIAAYHADYSVIQEHIHEAAEAKGYQVEFEYNDDLGYVPEANGKKVIVSINSPDFVAGGTGKVVQYGDEIGVSVSKKALISFYGNVSSTLFNMNCKKVGISQQYFKEVA